MQRDWVTLCSFRLLSQAKMAQATLAEEGIISTISETRLADHGIGGVPQAWSTLKISAADVAPAIEVVRLAPEVFVGGASAQVDPYVDVDEPCLACGAPLAETDNACADCGWTFADDRETSNL